LGTLEFLKITETHSQLLFILNEFFYKIELFNQWGLMFNKIVVRIIA
jgi:hypothetical protein